MKLGTIVKGGKPETREERAERKKARQAATRAFRREQKRLERLEREKRRKKEQGGKSRRLGRRLRLKLAKEYFKETSVLMSCCQCTSYPCNCKANMLVFLLISNFD